MTLVPSSFLFRVAYPCCHVAQMPLSGGDVVDLPESCRVTALAGLDGRPAFADVRLAWNEMGLGLQVEVKGKEEAPAGDAGRPLVSDRVSLWIDTRDARTSHRATRFCHQIHLLPAGGGEDRDEPVAVPMKINRALQDAPLTSAGSILLCRRRQRGGYRLEAFLPVAALNGFDPEQHPRLGFHYLVRDRELGEQSLNVPGQDFPVAEDPSLWSTLELTRPSAPRTGRKGKRSS